LPGVILAMGGSQTKHPGASGVRSSGKSVR
jgi:hypothetical protein